MQQLDSSFNPQTDTEDLRHVALEYIAQAWQDARNQGLENEAIAHAALFAGLASLIANFGEDSIADLLERLPERIRAGEFSLDRVLQ